MLEGSLGGVVALGVLTLNEGYSVPGNFVRAACGQEILCVGQRDAHQLTEALGYSV